MAEPLDSFGDWLRQRRTWLGLTRPELAACVGCSVSALRKIEADERRPSRQLAELLSNCLQIPSAEKALFLDAARGVRRVARLGPAAQEARALPLPLTASPELAGVSSLTRPAGPNWNLPCPATPLLGREAELTTLAQLLCDPACRLLTLVGPGGIGKTRLAVEVSCNIYDNFGGSVFFAPLEATSSPAFIVPAIAQAIGLALSGPADPRSQLAHFLRDKRLLLLLDNLEHLLQGVELLPELLQKVPGLTLLVTSRERLELQGEWVFEVQGLPVPAPGQAGRVENSSAIQLFLQRARQARVDFVLRADEIAEVARICRVVEGMPLAIELAAAWVPVLSCTEIAQEIERGLDILSTRLRDVPERQRSLRAVFDYSWRLLSAEEQRALRRLSVFRGGFEREAARAVAGASLHLLSALVGKSFLRHASAGRYMLHELVRHYAAGRLWEEPEEELATGSRHSHYYAAYVAGLEDGLKGAQQQEALAAIDAEIDNIRAGWQWALEQHEETTTGAYLQGLMQFYHIRGWHEEGMQVCERAIAALEGAESPDAQRLVARLQVHQATALQYLAQLPRAQQLLQASLESARRLDSKADIAHALMKLGAGAIFGGEEQKAMAHFRQALELFEALDDHYGRLWALQELGWAAWSLDEVDMAQQYHLRSLPLLRERGPQSLLVWTLFEIGAIRRELGDYQEAQQFLEEARAVGAAINYHFALLSCLLGLGQTAELVGEYRQAQRYYQQAAGLRAYVGDVTDVATSLALLVRVTADLGDVPSAEGYLQELQAFHERSANHMALGFGEYGWAEMALAQRQLEAAAQHFRRCVTILRPTRRRGIALLAILRLGQVHTLLGDTERAQACLRDALQEAWKRSSIGNALEAMSGIAAIAASRGNEEHAAELSALVQKHPASSFRARRQADELLQQLRRGMPEGQLAQALQRGRVRPLETAVAELLRDGGPRAVVKVPL